MANGMLGIFGPDPDEEEVRRRAALDPYTALNERIERGRLDVERGTQDVVRGLTGAPKRPDRNAAAQALRDLARRVTPGSEEFYDQSAKILADYGFVEDADKMAQRKRALAADPNKVGLYSDLEKLQMGRDRAAKAGNAQAVQEFNDRIKLLLTEKRGSDAKKPEFLQMLDALAAETDPARRKHIEDWLAGKGKGGKGDDGPTAHQRAQQERWARQDAAADAERADKKAARDAKAEAEKQAVEFATEQTVIQIQREIDAAQRLYKHPGLSKLTGSTVGLVPGPWVEALQGTGALAHMKQIEGQVFLRALADLKSKSPTGASGLGQLTEREGDKIQNARAALSPQQPTDQFKKNLLVFMSELKDSKDFILKNLAKSRAGKPVDAPRNFPGLASQTLSNVEPSLGGSAEEGEVAFGTYDSKGANRPSAGYDDPESKVKVKPEHQAERDRRAKELVAREKPGGATKVGPAKWKITTRDTWKDK